MARSDNFTLAGSRGNMIGSGEPARVDGNLPELREPVNLVLRGTCHRGSCQSSAEVTIVIGGTCHRVEWNLPYVPRGSPFKMENTFQTNILKLLLLAV